jgi:hypothetical protein
MEESWKVEETVKLGSKAPKAANKERWDSNSIGSNSKREDTHLQQSELRRGTERLMRIFTGTTLDCTRVGTIRTTQ